MDKEAVERVARRLIARKFGKEGLAIFDPVPMDFPDRERAKPIIEARAGEARADARAAIAEVMAILGEPTEAMTNVAEAFRLHGGQGYSRLFKTMISASPLSQGGQADG